MYGMGRAQCGFTYDDSAHYIAGTDGGLVGSILLLNTDSLSEICTLSLKYTITCVNAGSKYGDLVVGVQDER